MTAIDCLSATRRDEASHSGAAEVAAQPPREHRRVVGDDFILLEVLTEPTRSYIPDD